jgi:hypothetical protein
MKPAIERIDVRRKELNQLLERAREMLSEEDYRKLKAPVDTLEYLTELVADKDTTIRHLRQLLLPPARRRPRRCSPRAAWSRLRRTARKQLRVKGRRKPARCRGMGRNGVDDFTGARQVEVLHQKLKPEIAARSAEKETFTGRKSPGCCCGLSDKRRWRPPSTLWNVCAAAPAGRCSQPKSRREGARRNKTRARRR